MHAAHVIVEAAKLGQFTYGPGDSPWYGAEFSTGDEATRAQERARRLTVAKPPQRCQERGMTDRKNRR